MQQVYYSADGSAFLPVQLEAKFHAIPLLKPRIQGHIFLEFAYFEGRPVITVQEEHLSLFPALCYNVPLVRCAPWNRPEIVIRFIAFVVNDYIGLVLFCSQRGKLNVQSIAMPAMP